MNELLGQLGINWKLLLSQIVNFGILIVVLTVFVYKPLTRVMEERRKKIEQGLREAQEAKARLLKVEDERLTVIAGAEKEASAKADSIIEDSKKTAERKRVESLHELMDESAMLIREAIAKTVELNPSQIDNKLTYQAVTELKEKIR